MRAQKKTNSVLQVKNLSKIFTHKKKTTKAVDNISFDLHQGEILGLLGPNGAGKTTTIQMLLNVLRPTSGNISYFGKSLQHHSSDILQYVSFASTYINLPWRMTIFENLDVYGRLYGLNKKQRQTRIDKFLDFFEIRDQKNKKFRDLSAGQRTRVMLVKSFLAYPKVALLDEPTSSLDPDIAQQVKDFILNQRKKYETAILFTSHNMAEVAAVCDRVIFLHKGKIVASDKPRNLVSSVGKIKLKLFVGDGVKRTRQVCKKMKLDIEVQERKVLIKLEENQIADCLNQLASKKVDYQQIDIVKPTLEDYFIKLATQQRKK